MDTYQLLLLSGAFGLGFLIAWLWLQSGLSALVAKNAHLEADLGEFGRVEEDLNQSRVELATLKSQLDHEKQLYEEKITLLNGAREQLATEFENLANRIFDDKQQKFHNQSRLQLDAVVNPLREQLGNFHKKVEDVYQNESRERHSLIGEIRSLKELNQQISEDAVNLANALKGDNKAQGNWGEMVLERILERSGLVKGREYETQVSLKDDDGKRRNPDVIVRLPEEKDIIIDAKMALLDYDRYCSADDEEEKGRALKAHVNAIKTHINGLSGKAYEHLDGVRTLDFVLMFIPVEAAFMVAVEADHSVFQDAFDKGIIVVSPTTLLATLRTVQSIWRYEKQNRNAETIALEAGKLYDQFVLVLESLEEVGVHIERASRSHDAAIKRLSTGRGNLVGRVQRLESLGAKTKKQIPSSLLETDDDEMED